MPGMSVTLVRPLSGLKTFLRETAGSIAIAFAIATVPMTMMTGLAVDYTNAVTTRSKLQKAVDAAGLAAINTVGTDVTQLSEFLESYLKANLEGERLADLTFNVIQKEDAIRINAQGKVDTTLLSILGIPKMEVSVLTEIHSQVKDMEVVLVLDNTGSMGGSGKMEAMKESAKELVEILFGPNDIHPRLKVSVVPFVTAVNIRSSDFQMEWMDTTAQNPTHGINFEDEDGNYIHDPAQGPVNHFELFDQVTNTDWKGCVEARPAPYDLTDDAPDPSNPDTLWVPYFWPDEPDDNGYNNDWIDYDGPFDDEEEEQQDLSHYAAGPWSIDETPRNTSGPNKSCPRPLLPLTNNKAEVLAELEAMEPHNNGGTNVAQGLVWGWRAISPTPPFTQGAAYTDDDVEKVIVVLTDGHNFVVNQNTHNESDYNSYNYLEHELLGTDSTSTAASKVADKMSELCDSIKQEGVEVYSIVFRLNNQEIQKKFEKCATSPENYFNSKSNAELGNHFVTIGTSLSDLRISK